MYQINRTENSCAYPMGEEGKAMLADMNHHHAVVTAMTLRYLAAKDGETILDIGCGGGRALKLVSEQIAKGKLYGVDYSEISVQCTKEENAADVENGKIEVCLGSVSELPFKNEMFDKAYSIESYFFWPDLVNDLREIFRVLKSGGKVCISENVMSKEKIAEINQKEFEKCGGMHPVSPETFTELLKKAGFVQVEAHLQNDGERDQLCMEAWKPEKEEFH